MKRANTTSLRLYIHPAAILDEKAAATLALGSYAEETLVAFAPYLERSLEVVLGLADYFHEEVREQAYTALPCLLKSALAAFPNLAPGAAAILCSV